MLRRQDRLHFVQKQLEQAEEDVRSDRDQTRAKQRFLDATDRIREGAGAELFKTQAQGVTSDKNGKPRAEGSEAVEGSEAAVVWSIAVSLLGSGAERLEAKTKRDLVSKIVKLSSLIVDGWTRAYHGVNWDEIKRKFSEDGVLASKIAKSQSDQDLNEAQKTVEYIVEFFEYMFMLQPFLSIVAHLCEEARDNVLAESIANTAVGEGIEELLRNLWLSDINVPMGRKGLLRSIKVLPKGLFVRSAIAAHILTRVYWRHWRKEERLHLLDAASESLAGAGLQYDKSELKRIIEKLPDTEDLRV
jgi:hypothetical protein